MYTPASFRETRLSVLHEAIRSIPFATLVTAGANGIEASHLPFVLVPNEGPWGTLYAHVAKPNDHVIRHSGEVLSIFSGAHAYISPNGYPGKATHHREVPTWNYIVIHAYGRVETYDDPGRLRAHLASLTSQSEHDANQPVHWKIDDAPDDYVEANLRAIVGVRLSIGRVEGKWKLGQNRPVEDRLGAAQLLAQRPGEDDHLIADAMRATTERH